MKQSRNGHQQNCDNKSKTKNCTYLLIIEGRLKQKQLKKYVICLLCADNALRTAVCLLILAYSSKAGRGPLTHTHHPDTSLYHLRSFASLLITIVFGNDQNESGTKKFFRQFYYARFTFVCLGYSVSFGIFVDVSVLTGIIFGII